MRSIAIALWLAAFALGTALGLERASAMDMFPMSKELRDAGYRETVEELIFNVNLLHEAGFEFDEFPHDVLAVYYADFVQLELVEAGIRSFRSSQMPLHPATKRDIVRALKRVGANGHRELFERLILGRSNDNDAEIDRLLAQLRASENIERLADALLRSSREIEWIDDAAVDRKLAEFTLERKLFGGKGREI